MSTKPVIQKKATKALPTKVATTPTSKVKTDIPKKGKPVATPKATKTSSEQNKKVQKNRYNIPNNFRYDHEIVSWAEAQRYCNLDAPKLSGVADTKLFVASNVINYYILANTWFMLLSEHVSVPRVLAIKDYAMVYGLLQVIVDCNNAANTLIEYIAEDQEGGNISTNNVPAYLLDAILECVKNDDLTDVKLILQVLRYPKRFSPCHAELLKADGLRKFAIANNRCRVTNDALLTCTFSRDRILRGIKSALARILRGYKVKDYTKGYFSSGVAADAKRPLADKLDAYSAWESYLHHPMYPLGSNPSYKWPTYGCFEDLPLNVCKVEAVPKSFKTCRIIAEEDSFRQFRMQCVRAELERVIGKNGYTNQLDLRDQDGNRLACFEGSAFGRMATIDLSSASDTLSRVLVQKLMPNVFRDVCYYLPSHCDYPNPDRKGAVERRKLHMFCTSGAATTFVVESLVFLAICIYATEVASVFQEEKLTPPRVFGDDMLVDCRAYETALDLLDMLGFIVNQDKSYGSGPYRESCGAEYVYGMDVSTKYFPRATLTWNNDSAVATSLSSLCALQHRLYGCFHAARFLAQIVKKIEPRMTCHPFGCDCADLWHTYRVPQESVRPCYCPLDSKRHPDVLKWALDHENIVTRYRHLALEAKTRDNTKEKLPNSKLSRSEIVEMWLYVRFLQFGPSFATPLDELLRISEKPSQRYTLSNSSVAVWDYVIE